MGKRIELTEVYRQPRPASSSGRTSDFGSEKARSNRAAGTKKAILVLDALNATELLAHKRAVKAASMRRYRAKKKEGK